jgi:hypothetical protein
VAKPGRSGLPDLPGLPKRAWKFQAQDTKKTFINAQQDYGLLTMDDKLITLIPAHWSGNMQPFLKDIHE